MSGERIYLYGAGGLGREVLELIRDALPERVTDVAGFFDDGVPPGTEVGGYQVIGGLVEARGLSEPSDLVFALSSTKVKANLAVALSANPNIRFPNVIHPTAQIKSAIGSVGVVIGGNCAVSVDVTIGNFVFLNNTTLVGHDTTIGDCVSIMSLVAISGNITIGKGAFIGAGSAILQGLSVGGGATVGMGSVVLRDVPENSTVLGNPAVRID